MILVGNLSNTVKPRQVKGHGDRQQSSKTPRKGAKSGIPDNLTPYPN